MDEEVFREPGQHPLQGRPLVGRPSRRPL